MIARRTIFGMVVVIAMVLLAGCSAKAPQTTTVSVVSQGTSPLESNRAVLAARASDVAIAAAWNALDFDTSGLHKTTADGFVDRYYEPFIATYVTHSTSPIEMAGPEIWLPTSVTPTSRGYTISGCDASADWYVSKNHTPSYNLTDGRVQTWTVAKSSSGSLIVGNSVSSSVQCDATGAYIAKFLPSPKVREATISAGDVTAPRGY